MIEKVFSKIKKRFLKGIDIQIESIKLALGRIESRQLRDVKPVKLEDIEFQVFSQGGEDGIIQYLIRRILYQIKYLLNLVCKIIKNQIHGFYFKITIGQV